MIDIKQKSKPKTVTFKIPEGIHDILLEMAEKEKKLPGNLLCEKILEHNGGGVLKDDDFRKEFEIKAKEYIESLLDSDSDKEILGAFLFNIKAGIQSNDMEHFETQLMCFIDNMYHQETKVNKNRILSLLGYDRDIIRTIILPILDSQEVEGVITGAFNRMSEVYRRQKEFLESQN